MINNTVCSVTHTTIADPLAWYSIPFDYIVVQNVPQISVRYNNLNLTYGTGYTVGQDGLQLLVAPETGKKLDIIRTTPLTQEVDFQTGLIDPDEVEHSFDLCAMRDQELRGIVERTIELPLDHEARIQALEQDVHDIEDLVPTQATPTNQLADKGFVNSSIATSTATFRGTYSSLAELEAVTADANDYGFVESVDAYGNTLYSKYKYTVATEPASWVFEYTLNNSSFTAEQWAAINSGVTSSTVTKVNNMPVLVNSVVVDSVTGAISIIASSTITNVVVKTLYGATIAGTLTTNMSQATFVPTNSGDTIYGNWCLEVV